MRAYHILGFWNGNTALNTIHGTTSKCFVEDNPHINKSKGLVLVWVFFFLLFKSAYNNSEGFRTVWSCSVCHTNKVKYRFLNFVTLT